MNLLARLCLVQTGLIQVHHITFTFGADFIIFLSYTMIPWTGIALMLMRMIKHF